jgi:hypothetical protein
MNNLGIYLEENILYQKNVNQLLIIGKKVLLRALKITFS